MGESIPTSATTTIYTDTPASTSAYRDWSSIIGNERAREALMEAIEHPIKHRDLFAQYGHPVSHGVLLYGPPGCGKTMFGKAAASALARLHNREVELLSIAGPSIQSSYVGETEQTIRNIFAYPRAYKQHHGHQLVIFIDEADAILPSRKSAYRFEISNVSTFLTEMDGLGENGAFVILATNRPEALDEALLRDGRCDRKIKVERPSYDAAIAIAAQQMVGQKWANMLSPASLIEYLFDPLHLIESVTHAPSGRSHHFTLAHTVSGAMIVGLVARAKAIAMRRDMTSGKFSGLQLSDLREAVDEQLREARGMNHDYAMQEFIEEIAIPAEERLAAGGMN